MTQQVSICSWYFTSPDKWLSNAAAYAADLYQLGGRLIRLIS